MAELPEPPWHFQKKIARDSLERYCGSSLQEFGQHLLLTNFPRYLQYFAETRKVAIHQGSIFQVAHDPQSNISLLDFKVGSPVAALVVDLCACLPFQSALLLGMCGGLRKQYRVGDYLMPVASIRGEGTSDFYFPPEVPALCNFLMSKAIAEELDAQNVSYHVGITHTTNIRFWEFNESFIKTLKATRAQAIEMECATLFAAAYRRKFPLGALLLISDLPLQKDGIKTKQSSQEVFAKYTADHVEKGIAILKRLKSRLS